VHANFLCALSLLDSCRGELHSLDCLASRRSGSVPDTISCIQLYFMLYFSECVRVYLRL